ncbi:uncharacterized protein LOC100214732 isoform X2 [Hydra vulgaris]|uniref:Uncharacterized protein LOC100214732 isoform X2 n=1 Tax=Hydra vulgaris TaxID=6087 RepID=A0ABM4DDC7_HYDVU
MEEKEYTYGYPSLYDYSKNDTNETGVCNKIPDGYENEEPSKDNKISAHGIGVLTAGIFIVGEVCGAGVVTFPQAMSKTGWLGLPLMLALLFVCTYCGILLGYAWKRAKHQRLETEPIRDPYPFIGEIAFGKKGRNAVTVCLNTVLFFGCVIYLILCAEILQSIYSFHIGLTPGISSLRIWLLIISIVIIPFTWLGTPKDFWFVGVGAAFSTTLAVILIITKYILIRPNEINSVEKAPVTIRSFSSAFGTIVFGYTGAGLFPTIQSDMKNPTRFVQAASIGYAGIGLLYIPTAVGGFLTIGKDLNDSILETLTHYDHTHNLNHGIVAAAELLFASHFLCAFVLTINPLVQQMERFFNVPYEFSRQRIYFRTLAVLLVCATCEVFPQFGPIVDLIGGSLNVFLCFFFPISFYLKLYPETALGPKLIMGLICFIALIGGVLATTFNILNIKASINELYFKHGGHQ